MTCELCGKYLDPKDYCSVDIGVHYECSKLIDNMPENRKRQQSKIDEIITFLKEHHKVDLWSGEIPDELQLINIIPRLEKLKEEL